MSDGGDYREDEYESMDEYELLESLENEDKDSRRSSKSKISIIIGGLLLGALAVFLLSDNQVKAPLLPTPKTGKVLPKIAPPEAEPKKEGNADQEVAKKEKKPESVDERLAKLQQQNLIGEDLAAPGTIGENAPNATGDEPKPQATATTKKQEEVSPKPLLVKAETRPKSAGGAKPVASAGKGPYAIKVIATPNAVQALDRRDKLEALGYKAKITKKGKVRQNLYMVESGSFDSVRSAARQSQRFANSGFQSKVSYVGEKKKVVLSLGSFSNRDTAEKLADRAYKAGFRVKVKKRSEPQDLYLVRVGAYQTKSEAEKAIAQLRRHGFSSIGVDKLAR